MSLIQRLIVIILLAAAIIGLIFYSEQIEPVPTFTDSEKEKIENTHYASQSTAVQELMDAAADAEGANSYITNPLTQSKPLFYAVITSSSFDEEEGNEYYTMSYIIKDAKGYRVKIRDRDIQLKKVKDIMIDTYQIGNTKIQYYIGPEKDLPFKEDGGISSVNSDKIIVFHREIMK